MNTIIKNNIKLFLLRLKYKKSVFYRNTAIDSVSEVGENTVFFSNVKIINSKIGDYSFIQKNSVILNCTIGRFCSIADNVHIGLGQHPLDQVSTHPAFYSINQPIPKTFATEESFEPYDPITIGNDVWVGYNAIIMDNITIGDGAVIAAGAVVTKNVDSFSVVGGVPAKHIKYRFDKNVRDKLEKLKWWDKDESWLRENSYLFHDPSALINNYEEHTVND